MDVFNSKDRVFNFFLAAIIIALLIQLFIYHLRIIYFPYQLEYREGATVQTTNILLDKSNPFTFEKMPENTNVYGVFYNVVCFPFAKFFNSNLFIHRVVSGIFILLSCFIVYLFSNKRKNPLLFSLLMLLILYASLLYYITPLTRPDSLGLFLFLLSLYIPFRYNYSYRSLFINIFIGILAFFTKPFFLLLFPFLSSYIFFFNSKKKGIIYGILSVITLIPIILFGNMFFETFLINTFFNPMNYILYDFLYMIKQVFFYIFTNIGIFIFLFIVLVSFFIKKIKQRVLAETHFHFKKMFVCNINFLDVNKPFFANGFYCNYFYLMLSLSVFSFKLGGNEGAWMTYLYQLVSPFLILSILELIKNEFKWKVVFAILGILNVLFILFKILPNYSARAVEKNWLVVTEIVKKNNTIFNSPAIVSILQANNKYIYDSGHSEYFIYSYVPKQYKTFILFQELDKKSNIQIRKFSNSIIQSVKAQKFDIIIFPNFSQQFLHDSILQKYYYKESAIDISMPHTLEIWNLEIWKPFKPESQ